MGIIGIVLLVFFVIVAALLILLVLAQNEEGDSLGGIFAGGSSSAFGSRSGNVLTRATTVLGALFLVISFLLALINRSPAGSGVEEAARQLSPETNDTWIMEDEAPPASGGEALIEGALPPAFGETPAQDTAPAPAANSGGEAGAGTAQ